MTRHLFYIFLAVIFATAISANAGSALTKTIILEKDIAYLRVGTVDKGLAGEIQSARSELMASNKISGIILDVRFASGDDVESAKAAAGLFAEKKLPLAVLINDKTTDAAIELAKDLRTANDGLLFGSSTGIKPDVVLNVKSSDEKEFFKNPYTIAAANSGADSNRFLSFVERVSEADLVRAKIKDGEEAENFQPRHVAEPAKPVLRDPVLARGLDFIKGETIWRLTKK